MAVLDLIKKVKVQTLSFEKHPCRDLDMETKVHYLNALALIANEDGEIVEKEKEYLTMLINSFGLSEDSLNEYIEFAKNPDESGLVEMMNAFGTKDIKYNLMVDAMILAQRDGEFCESEKALMEQYFEMFKISAKEEKDLKYIFELFYAQDARALARYFNRNRMIKQSLFNYLLEYYKIDLEYALKEEEKELLDFKWFKPTFDTGGLYNATEIMKYPISNAQFFIYLNARYDENAIVVEENRVYKNDEEKTVLMELENSDISFKDASFSIENSTKDDEKITGITPASVEDFVKWINGLQDKEYKIVAFYGGRNFLDKINLSSLKTVFSGNEFFYYEGKVKVAEDLDNSFRDILCTFHSLDSRISYHMEYDESEIPSKFSFRLMR